MADESEKFDAAVGVIRSLPKTGSFQPSYDKMLKFYGYYKQAKEGPCKEAKPAFWDMVKKAKWEAWSKLGNISKENAMENYVNELKQVIEKMPESDEVSQFIDILEPFYNLAYENKENTPPIFNIFRAKHDQEQVHKMNGHLHNSRGNGSQFTYPEDHRIGMQNGHIPLGQDRLDTSEASLLHNIEITNSPENELNGDIDEATNLLNNETMEEMKDIIPDIKEGNPSSNHLILSESVVVVNNDHRDYDEHNGDDDDEEDDELFCDSLGPELLVEEVDQKEVLHARGESIQEDNVHVGSFGLANHSSLSDIEVIEHIIGTRNNADNMCESSSLEKISHVHFEDSNASLSEENILKNTDSLSRTCNAEKKSVVQPNQLGAGSGGGDERELLRDTSERQQVQRNGSQQSARPARYGHRYRRRSQESDSDESPGRSDPNSSSERDDVVIDKIADILIEIQESMKKILERLKRVENSLQRNEKFWFDDYRPSKTVVFLILWPFVVNIIFKFLQRRYNDSRKR